MTPFEEILNEAEIKAQELKVNLKRPSLLPVDVAMCEENPLRNLYISIDGEVSPCVYLYPPVSSPFKRIFCGSEYQIEKLSFGNIFKEPIAGIWNKKEYVEFRNRFTLREKRHGGFSLFFRELMKSGKEPLPEPPQQCKTCHKILGV